LVPRLGGYGVPIAASVAFATATAGMVLRSQRGPKPVPFTWGALASIVLLAAVLGAGERAIGPGLGDWRALEAVAIIAAFPLTLIVVGLLTRREMVRMGGLVRDVASPRRGRDDDRLVSSVRALPKWQQEALAWALDSRNRHEGGTRLLEIGLTRATRRIAGLEQRVSEFDVAIGGYLASRMSVADRDVLARGLVAGGVDPAELDTLEQVLVSIRRVPPERWDETGGRVPTDPR
jgi:hypothetical protein